MNTGDLMVYETMAEYLRRRGEHGEADAMDALVAEVRRLRVLVLPEGATVLVPRDPTECYECGVLVGPDEGEKHGRSGWVHFSCLEAASP